MFRSVFAKYIFAFMLIILISFTVLTAIVGSMVNSYTMSVEATSAQSAASAVSKYLESQRSLVDISDLSAYCGTYQSETSAFLDAIALANTDEITLFIVNNDGWIIAVDNTSFRALMGKQIPKQIMNDVNSGVGIEDLERIEGIIAELADMQTQT